MIKLDKVTKKFGTGTFGLSDISFDVAKGEFVFLVEAQQDLEKLHL